MKQDKSRSALLAVLSFFAVLIGLMACGVAAESERDGAGMTRQEATASIEDEFKRVGERYDRMIELLTEAQLQISDGEWKPGMLGMVPRPGRNKWAVRGMGLENSYYMELFKSTFPPGGVGEKKDLDPMLEYFAAKGWPTEVYEWSTGWAARADTGEGFMLSWQIQQNGKYNIDIISKTFWGSSKSLLREVVARIPPAQSDFDDAPPGVAPKFPDWNDPDIYDPVEQVARQQAELSKQH